MIAKICNLKAHEFVHTFGDLHLYANHKTGGIAVSEPPKPTMLIHGEQKEITDFRYEDFELIDYDPHPE